MTLLLTMLLALQAPPDTLLARLAGGWEGTGTVLGQPARVRLTWAWTLDGRFLRLEFVNDMGPEGRTRRFEGHAYYRPTGDGAYRGTWFDSAGQIRPIEARAEGDALVSRWGSPDVEEGETVYRLLADGRLEVTDRVKQKDGTWRPFGATVLVRVP